MSFGNTAGLAMILAFAHAGCGGDAGTKPSGEDSPAFGLNLAPQEWAPAGRMNVGGQNITAEFSADWAFRGNNVDVYVTPDDCVDTPTALSVWSCVIVAKAESETAKPERLTFLAEAGASYKLFVVNRGPRPDTVTVTLTTR